MSGKARPKTLAPSAQIDAAKRRFPRIRAGNNVRTWSNTSITAEADSRCNTIFIPNPRPEHEPDSFFVAERDLVEN